MSEMLRRYKELRSEEFSNALPHEIATDPSPRYSRVVIISTVRSRKRFLPMDKIRGMGLIHEPRRFNVSMTRAKELMLVVGNAETLTVS